ncbi:SOS response-associated peptidase family protein [Sphingomonas oligophenolica]|uniref:Abasic site processing protein n=1 Tax=Sphingomonas oligophenolica TaxID=301154 RepID=A0A502CJG7_9SPHN|nr:SOS response-associated peptidase [Sphingomonas oligophenolica]TPG13068.1 SOS response-associated peptidase [Sphingomonas oligophenolica]
MCNEVARRIALGQLRDDWGELKIPLVFPEGFPNLASVDSIRITDPTLVIRAAANDTDSAGAGQGAEGVVRRWSWPGPSGKPVYNYRSDGRDLRKGRCLIPVDGFYEFTAPEDPKAKRKDKWRFTHARDDWFCIAGLWRAGVAIKDAPQDGAGEAFTLLTTEPGPDIAPYHSRQVVVLDRADYAGWLDGSVPSADLCRPAPAGTLLVEPVR